MSYTDRLFKEGSALTRFSHHARAEKTLSILRASGKTKFNRVLDYGCADGWFLKALYDNAMSAQGIGVDINDDDLAKSRALFAGILNPHRGHKGFDYRKLRERVKAYFEILSTDFSPFPFMKQFLNSTIYWRCKPKPL